MMSGPTYRDKVEVMKGLLEHFTFEQLPYVIRSYRALFNSAKPEDRDMVIADFTQRGFQWRRTTDGNPHITYYKEGARDFATDTLIILSIEDSEVQMFVSEFKENSQNAGQRKHRAKR